MIKGVLHSWLSADSEITSALATYQFTTGVDSPAIFTSRVIPKNASFPAIIIDELGGPEFDTRSVLGADIGGDIRVYGDKNVSAKVLEDLALNIWARVHRAALDALLETKGYDNLGCRCQYPGQLDDPDGYPGYVMPYSVRVLAQA